MHQAVVIVSSSARYSSHTFVHKQFSLIHTHTRIHTRTHTHMGMHQHTHTQHNKDFKSTFWTMFIFSIYPHINIAFQRPSDIRLTESCLHRLAEAEYYLIGC